MDMKRSDIPHLLIWLVALFWCGWAYGQPALGDAASSGRNYIQRTRYLVPFTSTPSSPTVQQAMRDISYYDGLGRLWQTVSVKASGGTTYQDVVVPVAYDPYGRMKYHYLPYTTATGAGGAFKADAITAQLSYYGTTPPAGQGANTKPYAVTRFEVSPLERPLEQGSAGPVWQPAGSRSGSSGRTVAMDYVFNNTVAFTTTATTRRVTQYGVSLNASLVPTLTSGGVYGAGTLQVTVTRDENWSGGSGTFASRLHGTEHYTDKEGRVILTRTFNLKGSTQEILSTYYVYDDLGQLTFVLPPGVNPDLNSGVPGSGLRDQFGYEYRYDALGRLVERKLPGRGWEYLVYDRLGRVIMSQDAVQRAQSPSGWIYTKYDGLDRVVSTGLHRVTYASRAAAQSAADAHAAPGGRDWEERIGGSDYTNVSFPTTGLTPLAVHYYDDYGFSGASLPELAPSGVSPDQQVTHLLTGSRIYRDDGTSPLMRVYYYDAYGRMIQSAFQNHLGGTDYTTHTYDFTGQVLSSKAEHRPSPSGTLTTVLTSHSYDHRGRPVGTRQKINAQGEFIQSRLTYNQVGQLRRQQLYSTNSGSSFAGSLEYSYNERGWLSRTSSSHFTQELSYHVPISGALAQYNGNISEQHWGHGTTTPNRFVYSYDPLDRLTAGSSSTSGMSETLAYDRMGNISSLARDGGTAIGYSYSGNKLTALSGGISGSYSYDANGNALTDRNGLSYTYNHLNLPVSATKSGTSVTYTYDALGTKLRSVGAQSAGQTKDYVGAFEYTGGTLDRIHTEEGYITMSGSSPEYYYYLRDHLGNVRSVLTPSGSGFSVVQQQDYYPFGLRKTLAGASENRYLYNGKEIQGELGGQYDYGARLYDPVIGRWNVPDPMADSYYSWSPYNYTLGNPIKFIDPNGMFADYFDQDGNYLGNDGVDDDKIRIAPVRKSRYTSNYNTLPFNFYNRDGSVNRQAGLAMSQER